MPPLKYSAKELDRENGLDLYDSHARFYDSMIGRTTSQDPLAEKYSGVSPYLWCAANPIKFIDKNGIKRISFNIHIVDVDNTSNTKKADELSTQYKQEIKDNQPGKNGKAAVFMNGSTNGAFGLTRKAIYITISSGAPNGTKSHELYHTTGVPDNGYDKGGILNSPPQIITPEEVSLMWNLIPEKK